ncbi:hypothetical protein [Streptomyces sp. NBC_01320]|uniref:hypothetical protein n=1 Tax=Streptomyces sp. NBC_01320 TaxID=2903824 RepID=UPI002E1311DD|nr:hypothetical protein OG395_41085 [Streptomyces sp. NBC_01320]
MIRIAHIRTRLAAIAAALLITAGASGSAAALGDWAPGTARATGSGSPDRYGEAVPPGRGWHPQYEQKS